MHRKRLGFTAKETQVQILTLPVAVSTSEKKDENVCLCRAALRICKQACEVTALYVFGQMLTGSGLTYSLSQIS